MTSSTRIRTLIVDDSAVARQLLQWVLTRAGDFEVVDAVHEGERAVERVAALRPDLVTMDLHLPGIDGLEATRRIMRRTPSRIAIVAASANIDDAVVFEALRAGALTAVQRPLAPGHPDYLKRRRQLLAELRTVARASLGSVVPAGQPVPPASGGSATGPAPIPQPAAVPLRGRIRLEHTAPVEIIAVAASTGGPQALHALLAGLPATDLPPIVVVQHITTGFVKGLADWLASITPGAVRVATDGERLMRGTILLAPDDRHLTVTADRRVRLLSTGPVAGHRPSANVLFDSVAVAFGPRALGIVLTGMGRDGADGLLRLRQAGGITIAEDPATAVIGGMPSAAIDGGAVSCTLPLGLMGTAISSLLQTLHDNGNTGV